MEWRQHLRMWRGWARTSVTTRNKDTASPTYSVRPNEVTMSINKSTDLVIWTRADVLLETDETDVSFEMLITELHLDLISWRVRRQLDPEFSNDPSYRYSTCEYRPFSLTRTWLHRCVLRISLPTFFSFPSLHLKHYQILSADFRIYN